MKEKTSKLKPIPIIDNYYIKFLIAAKAIDLVGNPVREICYIAFVVAYVEGIKGYFAVRVVVEVFSVAAG